MTAALQLSSVPTTQIARLRQFLTWFLVAAVLATILQWIGAALAGSLAITLTGVVTGCMSITTLFAQSQLSHNKLNLAILLTCANFCVASIAMLVIIPLLLPVMILGPTIALAIALPYVDSRTLKRMSIVTWFVVMAQAILAQVIIPLENLAPLLSSSLMVVLMCIAFPLLLLLLWQFHNRLTETLTQTQAANLSLQIAVTSAEKARAQAEQANELKSQFLANMSHELRTPLNSIINFTRILSTGMRGPVNVEQLDYLQRVRQSGEHLLGLINDILDLSKIEAGRMELYTETLHIPDLVQGVLATVAGLTKGKPIELLQELEANLPPIKADRTRIRQVLLNLLSNAAKFTDAGTITVGATCHDGQLIMRVTDTGIGIAQADLETVFEEFRQVEADTNRRYEGTGLGLAICRRLIEIHGGRIWVESTLGVGSTFAFSLPAMPAASPAPRETIITTNGTGIPVLVIDDDPAAIEIVAAYLERDGYTVYGITDSRRAIEEAEVIKPAVIILDVLMPHKDGWELLAEIKANPALRDLPVVLYTIVDEQKLGFYLGASAYLTKPVDAEKLRATVTQLAKGDATILVIDDDPNAREIVTQQLEVGGSYRVRSASGGQDGLNQIASAAPDLIILDLMMPEIDGFAVLDQLDLNPHTRAIPVIVLTAKSLDPQEHDMLNRRVKGLLAKGGTDAEQLLSKVNGLVGTINSLWYTLHGGNRTFATAGTETTEMANICICSVCSVCSVAPFQPFGASANERFQQGLNAMVQPEEAYVLVIEDDANNLMVVTDFLHMLGVKYVNARASGWQSLKLAESMPQLDLILLDIQLPHEDGYAILGRIRAHPKLNRTRVVAVTANVLPQDEAKARAAGFDGFIGKPLDFDRFPTQIRELLAGNPIWMPR